MSHWKGKWAVSFILPVVVLLVVATCKPRKHGSSAGILGLLGLSAGSQEACKNQSGLVICIPPGFRF